MEKTGVQTQAVKAAMVIAGSRILTNRFKIPPYFPAIIIMLSVKDNYSYSSLVPAWDEIIRWTNVTMSVNCILSSELKNIYTKYGLEKEWDDP
jgi:hypothetical protein